ncbi:type II toxin-antitoxin system RelB/DinJ family antitoxin, partial [Escherichia coli]|nr:translation repressor RelB [Escherichia coli]
MTTTAAQINVRLDADLKRSGDAALSRAGMTPSQAVRALWQLAASLADRPGALEDI